MCMRKAKAVCQRSERFEHPDNGSTATCNSGQHAFVFAPPRLGAEQRGCRQLAAGKGNRVPLLASLCLTCALAGT